MKLVNNRMRSTFLRRDVLETFKKNTPQWMDADRVFQLLIERGSSISSASVYRILRELESCNVLWRDWRRGVAGTKKVIYRLRTTETLSGEYSIMCRHCGTSFCSNSPDLHNQIQNLALKQGWAIAAQPAAIHVVCEQCSKKSD